MDEAKKKLQDALMELHFIDTDEFDATDRATLQVAIAGLHRLQGSLFRKTQENHDG